MTNQEDKYLRAIQIQAKLYELGYHELAGYVWLAAHRKVRDEPTN